MTLDDLQRLNFRDVGNWPVLPKLGLLVFLLLLIIFLGFWFDWRTQAEDLDAARQKEKQLRETFLNKKAQAINLDLYRKQLADVEQSFGAMLKQLPNKSEMEALLTDINQAGLGRGLQFELFRPAPQEIMSDFYAELPITIRVTGAYHDIGAFASDVSQLSRIVTLNDIALSVDKGGQLALDAVAKTYRYLDPEEVAAQKKKERDAKGARKR
ncbi:MAG: type 4a pilus biogenesis protein PilO [Betaproteobacteria bacterium]|nr:type 4a pilus biogenesis protein PilO [Betaproteobacteria bacterium]